MKIIALHRRSEKGPVLATVFEFRTFLTRNKSTGAPIDRDTPELEQELVAALAAALERRRAPTETQVLAFYCDTRPEVLLDRRRSPLRLSG
jgi:hypothetical protein